MTIKVYISGICGSQEVRKQQQRVLFILQTMPIDLEIIDVTEPGRQEDLTFMQEEVKKHDKQALLPPQIFNDNKYCGDYADFQLANDDDEVMRFLKLEEGPSYVEKLQNASAAGGITQNGIGDHENKESESMENAESVEQGEVAISNDVNVVLDDNLQAEEGVENVPKGDSEPEVADVTEDSMVADKKESSEEESEEESD